MSTNYYAYYRLARDPDVTIKIHIAQVTASGATISTLMFPTFENMMDFLEYNEDSVTVRNEYGVEKDVKEMREFILGMERKPLTDDLIPYSFHVDPSGHLACRGVFF